MRACMYCEQPGGTGDRELRPYGPGGRDVCAGCMFDGPPERLKIAEQRFALQLGMAGDVAVIDSREEVGPRPATDEERALVGRGRRRAKAGGA